LISANPAASADPVKNVEGNGQNGAFMP